MPRRLILCGALWASTLLLAMPGIARACVEPEPTLVEVDDDLPPCAGYDRQREMLYVYDCPADIHIVGRDEVQVFPPEWFRWLEVAPRETVPTADGRWSIYGWRMGEASGELRLRYVEPEFDCQSCSAIVPGRHPPEWPWVLVAGVLFVGLRARRAAAVDGRRPTRRPVTRRWSSAKGSTQTA